MIRIPLFLFAVILVASAITFLANTTGTTTMRFGGTEMHVHSGLLIGLGLAAIGLSVFATVVISRLARLPEQIRRRREDGQRQRGLAALARGFEALAIGDASDAQRQARTAARQLRDPAITRLLTAQAAQMAGDHKTAEINFAAMLEAPETEFLGLRGLYTQAMAIGDRKLARDYAERAFRLRPGTQWAYLSVYGLHLDRGAWGDARDALLQGVAHGHEPTDVGQRKEAALLTAMAYAADASGDHETAMRDLDLALKRAPGFAPGAVLAARLEGAAGRRSKAGRILDDAWALSPHPAIARAMRDLYAEESVERLAERMRKLAARRPEADESQLLLAEQEIALGRFEGARAMLSLLLTGAPRARAFAAMARAMEGLHGPNAARPWIEKAAAAPLDPVPGADGAFNFTTDGWQRLIREYGDHGRLAPPPLEELQTALTTDQILLLSAPPIAAAPFASDAEAAAGAENGSWPLPPSTAAEAPPVVPDVEPREAPRAPTTIADAQIIDSEIVVDPISLPPPDVEPRQA